MKRISAVLGLATLVALCVQTGAQAVPIDPSPTHPPRTWSPVRKSTTQQAPRTWSPAPCSTWPRPAGCPAR